MSEYLRERERERERESWFSVVYPFPSWCLRERVSEYLRERERERQRERAGSPWSTPFPVGVCRSQLGLLHDTVSE